MKTSKKKPSTNRYEKARPSTLWLQCLIVAAAWLSNQTNGTTPPLLESLGTSPEADTQTFSDPVISPNVINDETTVQKHERRNLIGTKGSYSTISGVGVIAGVLNTVTVQSKNWSNGNVSSGGDTWILHVDGTGINWSLPMTDKGNGQYTVTYTIPTGTTSQAITVYAELYNYG